MNFDEAVSLAVMERKYIRRPSWPVKHIPKNSQTNGELGALWPSKDITRRWHAWAMDDLGDPDGPQLVSGWGGQVGADYADTFDGYYDGASYRPTVEDKAAQDWEFVVLDGHPPQPGEKVYTQDYCSRAGRERMHADYDADVARSRVRAVKGAFWFFVIPCVVLAIIITLLR